MQTPKFFDLLISLILFTYITTVSSSNAERYRSYIIHMDTSAIPDIFSDHHSWYISTLESLSAEDENAPIQLYTYKHVVNGFSAVLSKSQLSLLEKMPGHIATAAEQFGQLHTTHTPKFLGLSKDSGLWPAGGFGDDTVIGVFDTGIWPESESFKDRGMPPVPLRWRGTCENGTDFNSTNCNRKLIGARSFSKAFKQLNRTISTPLDYDSPRDFNGHGSHTSSTAAGSAVEDVDYFGYAKGTATGVAPLARLAMYKVIFANSTFRASSIDILAGMDQAIEDGVDIMSLSLGFPNQLPLYDDPIAIGAFAAIEKGIFVACSAGNRGSDGYTVHNAAPWITTVGAGSVDREFVAYVTLGDGVTTLKGKSVYRGKSLLSKVPLYYGHGNKSKQNCEDNSLTSTDVTGNFVYCSLNNSTDINAQMYEVFRAGAKGAIFATDAVSAELLTSGDFYFPFVAISPSDGEKVEDYLTRTSNATVAVKFQITELGTKPAPQLADFSSRGPSQTVPWVLKPDIMAPGVDILAAWVPNKGNIIVGTNLLFFTDYALKSGTSMAVPHVAGIAALLKSAHRDWSSAAIRSAMMTTADVTDNSNGKILDMMSGTPGTPLDFGSGHVNPNKALDPGLVYDIEVEDYIDFLCASNYTSQQIQIITSRSNYPCDKASLDLNYPSFIVILQNNTNSTSYRFKRVLTNVGDSQSVYNAYILAPSGMKVTVDPMTLTFGNKNSKAEFTMEVEINVAGYKTGNGYIGNYGYLSWQEVNGKHVVRSPIVSAYALGR